MTTLELEDFVEIVSFRLLEISSCWIATIIRRKIVMKDKKNV